jgi:Domain of unknown function (DUF4190)
MSHGDDDRDIPEVRPVRRVRPVYNEYPPEQDIGQDAGIRMLIPVGLTGWAIASGYLGLISVLLIPAPFALLTGILAIREMRRNPKKHGMGRAIFGIVMGTLGTALLVIALIGLLAAGLGRR